MSDGRKVVLDVYEGRKRLARLAQEERQRQGDHPPVEQLTAYHAGELEADDAARLQAHLAICRRCTRTLLDLPRFADREAETPVLPLPPDAGSPSLAQTEASWRAVHARLVATERRHPVLPALRSSPLVVERRHWPGFAFLAVAVVVVSFGVVLWRAIRPGEGARSVNLYLETSLGPSRGLDIDLPGPGGSLTVVYPVPDASAGTYTVEIQPLHGKGPGVFKKARPQAGTASRAPSVSVEFPSKRLAPGEYQLRISSPEGEILDQWLLRIHARG